MKLQETAHKIVLIKNIFWMTIKIRCAYNINNAKTIQFIKFSQIQQIYVLKNVQIITNIMKIAMNIIV